MEIKALGGCCSRSTQNYLNIVEAAKQMGINEEVEQVSNTNEIMKYGVMSTPGMVIDGKAVSSGRLLSVEDTKALIKRFQV